MGLKSVLNIIFSPFTFIWGKTNKFIPSKAKNMNKPTIIKEGKKKKDIPDIKSQPVTMQLSDNIVQHIKVNFSENAPEEKAFYLNNGKIIWNINELKGELNQMDNNTFYHHVTPDHNDFANWVKEVFKAEELAREISTEHEANRLAAVLERHRL